MKQPKERKITFRASEDMQKALEETAERLKCDVSQILRHLVKRQVMDKKLTGKDTELWG